MIKLKLKETIWLSQSHTVGDQIQAWKLWGLELSSLHITVLVLDPKTLPLPPDLLAHTTFSLSMASAGIGGRVNLWICWISAVRTMTATISLLSEGESLYEWQSGTWISSSIWVNVWSPPCFLTSRPRNIFFMLYSSLSGVMNVLHLHDKKFIFLLVGCLVEP